MELSGAVVVVTGAARGLGKAIAGGFAGRGAKVALVDLLADELQATAGELGAGGAEVTAIVADITERRQVEAMAERVRQELGPAEVLVNNAGSLSAIGPVWEVDPERWVRDVTVNLIGTFLVTRAVVKQMVERRGGYVVSLVGLGVDAPHPYITGYDSSQAGIVRLSETLAKEAGQLGLKAFSLFPGVVRTRMTEFISDSAEGHKWRPWFKDYLAGDGAVPADLAVEACLELVSGRADALSGRWISATREFADYLEQSEGILADDLLTLRLRPLK
ncbi:MAG: SDR family NAD(P)-dependent oxidoreductase [Anaerolineaceae bacterium]|nr:SDR family NAD(P)-dependent oxidoreductase [Anaerolineaceae bacterium]